MTIALRFYPEIVAGGYSRVDGSVEFCTRIRALLRPDMHVLDFGAGRGWAVVGDPNPTRSRLANLRGACAKVVGVDIDSVVCENPELDEAVVIQQGQPLLFAAGSFDLVVRDHVFEHVDDPESFAAEIDRVLRAGGRICARTPNRNRYIAWGARLVPYGSRDRVLSCLQRERHPVDVFPTRYRLNTCATLRRHFPDCRYRHCTYPFNTEPAYGGSLHSLWFMLWSWSRVAPEAPLRHIAHLHAKAPIFARKSGMTDGGSAGLLRRSGDNRAIIQLTRSWSLLGAMNIRHTLEHST